MKKILNATFQIFLCSKYSHYRLKISCTNQQDKIIHIWQDLHEKKIEKDMKKSNIENINSMDFWALF